MYKLTFTLKQHTPLIHFQHDQDGATLRATEVKPKLDKFIMEKLLKGEGKSPGKGYDEYRIVNDKEEYFDVGKSFLEYAKHHKIEWKEWLIGKGEHPALDYKILILSKDKHPDKIYDIKLITEADKVAITSKSILFSLRSFQENIVKLINENIDEFFVISCFGNRQNKGWGDFLPESLNSLDKFEDVLIKSGKAIFKSNRTFNTFNDETYSQLMRNWRILKSGNNNPYKKSLLFQYMCFEKKARWEKRKIKKAINEDDINFPEGLLNTNGFYPIDCVEYPNDSDYFDWNDNPDVNYPYRFIRILLGLPEHFEFRTNVDSIVYQVIMESNNDIERFKAPITFKWFNNHIYAIVEEIPDYIFSKNFSFKVHKKERRGNKWIALNAPIPIIPNGLNTPKSFNMIRFLNLYISQIGFSKLNYVKS
ncbi:MAG: hypothetical protein M0R21_13000 [Lentimicrobiaceae bacterium]|nr:hypothetical protein [Lentimicrobiaceae bacterium]